jgi:hypothetical protein
MPWTFTLVVMLGAGAAVQHGSVVLPTLDACEATRSAVIGLPPLDKGSAVCGACAQRSGEEPEPSAPEPYGGGVS